MADNDISPASILDNLTTRFVGRQALYYPTVGSTMDIARKAAEGGAAEGTIVIAEQQTAGRGRLERAWLSPRGSIALSIILRPTLRLLPGLNMVASLAVAHSIEKLTGLKTDIKWPNDVLIGGRKVCGILAESALRGNAVDWAVVGIGLNVNLAPGAFPEIASIATSLSAELGCPVARLKVLQGLLEEFELLYLALQRGEPVYEEWRDRLETLGKVVRVKSGDLVEEGVAESVDSDGSLLLRRSDGSLGRIVAGEATLRFPASATG